MLTNQRARGYFDFEYFDQGYFGVAEQGMDMIATAITPELFDAILQDPPTEIGYQPTVKINGVALDTVIGAEISGNRNYTVSCDVTVAGIVAPSIGDSLEITLAMQIDGQSADFQLYYGTITGVEPVYQETKTKISANRGGFEAYWTGTQYTLFLALSNPATSFTVVGDGAIKAEKQPPTDPIGRMTLTQLVASTNSDGEEILTPTQRVAVWSTTYPAGRLIEDTWPPNVGTDNASILAYALCATRVVTQENFGTVVLKTSLLPMLVVGQGFELDGLAGITTEKLRIDSFKHSLSASGFTSEIKAVLAWP
jgi:hypothetical protein